MSKLPKTYKIVEKFKYVAILAIAVIIAGVVFGVIRVNNNDTFLNFGIDFTGGATIEIQSEDSIAQADQDKMITFIESEGYRVNGDIQETNTTDGGYRYEIRLSYEMNGKTVTGEEQEKAFFDAIFTEETQEDFCGKLFQYTQSDLGMANLEYKDFCAHAVGASASDTLIKSAIWAIVVAIIVMLIYIVIRFTFTSALAAVCALAHDIIIMIAFMSIFNITINFTFIAAVITIIGYSINATIVIFDRVRAEKKLATSAELTDKEIANKAVTSTLTVTVLSTLTTLIMVVFLVLFSVATIQEFILPIIFGLIAGAISSCMIAPALWVKFNKVIKIDNKRGKKGSGYVGAVKQES